VRKDPTPQNIFETHHVAHFYNPSGRLIFERPEKDAPEAALRGMGHEESDAHAIRVRLGDETMLLSGPEVEAIAEWLHYWTSR
jgi:hypothetical protein